MLQELMQSKRVALLLLGERPQYSQLSNCLIIYHLVSLSLQIRQAISNEAYSSTFLKEMLKEKEENVQRCLVIAKFTV